MLVLGAIWWAWVGYAWLTNVARPRGGAAPLIFARMAAMLVAALAVPGPSATTALLFAVPTPSFGCFTSRCSRQRVARCRDAGVGAAGDQPTTRSEPA